MRPGQPHRRRLSLAARDAARLFASRLARNRGLRPPARPAVLRWRRLPPPPTAACPRTAAHPQVRSWSSRVQVNLDLRLAAPAPWPPSRVAPARAAGIREQRTFADRHHSTTSLRATTVVFQRAGGVHEPRDLSARQTTSPLARPAPPASFRTRWIPAASKPETRRAREPRPARGMGPARHAVEALSRNGRRPGRDPRPTFAPLPRIVRARERTFRTVAPPVRRNDAIAPTPSRRPPELVWRAQPKSIAVGEGPERLSMTSPRPSARVHPIPDSAPADAARAARLPAGKPDYPDAAQLDRLADDVIRRVEKRVRIERERRGL